MGIMELPKTVKIGCRVYKVKVVKKLWLGRKKVWGLCDLKKRIIYISKRSNTIETFLHEVIHAMLQFLGEREGLSEREDERLTEGLANMLLTVIRENPKMWRCLK